MRKTLIIVPMKSVAASKTRLAPSLGTAARARLVRLLYQRSLEFLTPLSKEQNATLAVVTRCPDAKDFALNAGADVIEEPANADLSGAITHAATVATSRGYQRLCVIPADLAAPSPDDFRTLMQSEADVTICPSADRGTNALLVSPPNALTFCYGPRSADLHLQEARRLGLQTQVLNKDSFSFDIDTGACLDRAIHALPDIRKACA